MRNKNKAYSNDEAYKTYVGICQNGRLLSKVPITQFGDYFRRNIYFEDLHDKENLKEKMYEYGTCENDLRIFRYCNMWDSYPVPEYTYRSKSFIEWTEHKGRVIGEIRTRHYTDLINNEVCWIDKYNPKTKKKWRWHREKKWRGSRYTYSKIKGRFQLLRNEYALIDEAKEYDIRNLMKNKPSHEILETVIDWDLSCHRNGNGWKENTKAKKQWARHFKN